MNKYTGSLFIPLLTVYYNKYIAGTKDTEYRPYGQRWNERTCYPGRRVLLSRGYGKHNRVMGTITSFLKVDVPPPDCGYQDVYGDHHPGPVACIQIRIDGIPARVAKLESSEPVVSVEDLTQAFNRMILKRLS